MHLWHLHRERKNEPIKIHFVIGQVYLKLLYDVHTIVITTLFRGYTVAELKIAADLAIDSKCPAACSHVSAIQKYDKSDKKKNI